MAAASDLIPLRSAVIFGYIDAVSNLTARITAPIAIPVGLVCAALWWQAIWLYRRIPHIADMYREVYGSVRHPPEPTSLFLFGFPVLVTAASIILALEWPGRLGENEAHTGRRLGAAMLGGIIFTLAALFRFHELRSHFGF